MALLMLTFKMAEEFKSMGIKVNALMINRINLSKEPYKKCIPIEDLHGSNISTIHLHRTWPKTFFRFALRMNLRMLPAS